VLDPAAAAQRPEDAEAQVVDMEERQRVDELVPLGPLPDLREASRFEESAHRGSTAPSGGPVVPDV
jgi:hypothetical protein